MPSDEKYSKGTIDDPITDILTCLREKKEKLFKIVRERSLLTNAKHWDVKLFGVSIEHEVRRFSGAE